MNIFNCPYELQIELDRAQWALEMALKAGNEVEVQVQRLNIDRAQWKLNQLKAS